jgi:hypothetical protein
MRTRNRRRALWIALIAGILAVAPVAAHADGGGTIGSGTRAGGYLGSGN